MYFSLFAQGFVDMLNNALSEGLLSLTQRAGLITLICKDSTKAEHLTNWRPISLLNVDYKILSKVLANRLKLIIAECVHSDQTCSIPGRSIHDNLHLVRNVIDYCNDKKIPGAIISYDQAKAFDRVSHDYLFRVLKAYGFGVSFINWVTLLYTDVYSSVLVNGYVTGSFKIERAVRQGCPLSALLYVLTLEPVLCAIRCDHRINGLRPPGSNDQVKVSVYADDTHSIVTDLRSINSTLEWFTLYGQASGAKLNIEKCQGLWLGPWKSQGDKPFDFTWSVTAKIFGVYFGENAVFTNSALLKEKIQKHINILSGRILTLRGKAVILNCLVLTKLWYVSSVFPLPHTTLKDISRMMFQFIWRHYHTDCVSRTSVIRPPLEGGLGVTHIETKIASFRAAHVKRLLSDIPAAWTKFALYWIGLQLSIFKPSLRTMLDPHAESPNLFYADVLKNIRSLNVIKPMLTCDDMTAKTSYNMLINNVVTPCVIEATPSLTSPTRGDRSARGV